MGKDNEEAAAAVAAVVTGAETVGESVKGTVTDGVHAVGGGTTVSRLTVPVSAVKTEVQ